MTQKAKTSIPWSIVLIGVALATSPVHPVAAQEGWTDDGTVVRLTTNGDQVGIGTLSPEAKLHVNGSTFISHNSGNGWMLFPSSEGQDLTFVSDPLVGTPDSRVTFSQNGNVGIGTTNPEARLQITGGDDASLASGGYLVLGPVEDRNIVMDDNDIIARRSGENSVLYLQPEGGPVAIGTRSTTIPLSVGLTVDGNVGVGTTDPQTRLQITGGGDANLAGGGYLTMGSAGGRNMVMDNNEILARDDGSVSTLHLQAEGGLVAIGVNGVTDANLNGGGSLTLGSVGGTNIVLDNNEIMARNNGNTSTLHFQADGGSVRIGGNDGGALLIGADTGNRIGINQEQIIATEDGDTATLYLNPVLGGQVAIGPLLNVAVPSDVSLAVQGKILSEEVEVQLVDDWPDYVFDDNYPLMSLNEVERSIKQNRHLPDVPSADEVQASGIALGEMQGLLLRKIEELTLYVIDLQKQLDRQGEG